MHFFMSWLLDSLDLPSRRKDTHWLMSRVDYGFNQWSFVSFVIKKCTYLWWNSGIYLVILMYFMQIYFHYLWSEIYRFCRISEFFVDLTRNVNYIEKQNSEKNQDKTQFENKLSLIISSNLLYFNFTKSR